MLLVPALHWSGALSFGALLFLAFGLGALSAPYFAAQRVIVPERSRGDVEEIPEHEREGLEYVYVSELDEVLEHALEDRA